MNKKNNNKDHKHLSEVLQDFVEKNRLQSGLDNVTIERVWNSEMGPAIKKYTTNIKLKRDTLYVQLSSSVLREELSYGKSKIIKNLNEAVGKDLIKTLVLR